MIEFRNRAKAEARLLANRRIDPETGCWIWTGCRDRKGYGRFTLKRADGTRLFTRAHRVSYELFVAEIQPDEQVDHECEVRSCFNPEHLKAISLLMNVHYRNHGRSNLTIEDLDEMDRMLMAEDVA